MFNTTVNSDTDVIKYGRLLVDKGAQSVIVSLGGDGAIYIDKEISIKAVNPQGKVVNTVGSGDSTVAGMVAGIASGLTIEKHSNKQSHAVLPRHWWGLSNTGRYRKIKSQVTISVLDGEWK